MVENTKSNNYGSLILLGTGMFSMFSIVLIALDKYLF